MSSYRTDPGLDSANSPTGQIPLAASPGTARTECLLDPKCDIRESRKCGACLGKAVEEARRVGPGEKLELALRQRRQFWMDTCREVREMQSPSRQVMELYRRHGCRLYAPDARQIQHVLDALDSALPGWERGHPELFYQTLELNFGELVRVRSSLGAE